LCRQLALTGIGVIELPENLPSAGHVVGVGRLAQCLQALSRNRDDVKIRRVVSGRCHLRQGLEGDVEQVGDNGADLLALVGLAEEAVEARKYRKTGARRQPKRPPGWASAQKGTTSTRSANG